MRTHTLTPLNSSSGKSKKVIIMVSVSLWYYCVGIFVLTIGSMFLSYRLVQEKRRILELPKEEDSFCRVVVSRLLVPFWIISFLLAVLTEPGSNTLRGMLHQVSIVLFVCLMSLAFFYARTPVKKDDSLLMNEQDDVENIDSQKENQPSQPQHGWQEAGRDFFVAIMLAQATLVSLFYRSRFIGNILKSEQWSLDSYDYYVGPANVVNWVPNDNVDGGLTTFLTLEWSCPNSSSTLNKKCQYTIDDAVCKIEGLSLGFNYGSIYYRSPSFVAMDIYNVDDSTCDLVLKSDENDNDDEQQPNTSSSSVYEDVYVNVLGNCASCEATPLLTESMEQLTDYKRDSVFFGWVAIVFGAKALWQAWKQRRRA